jgi:hypothetical protein
MADSLQTTQSAPIFDIRRGRSYVFSIPDVYNKWVLCWMD